MSGKGSLRDEGFAIDDEWKRIEKEKSSFKTLEAELDKENDDYNAQVRAVNQKADNAADVKRLRGLRALYDAKEAELTERKRRLLYDIDLVNQRSKVFNEKALQAGLQPREIKLVQFSADGVLLKAQSYKPGEPLSSKSQKGNSSSSEPSEPLSEKKVETRSAQGLKGGAASQPSKNGDEEATLIDQEWARIEKERLRLVDEDKRLNDEIGKLNNRIREVNQLKNNQAESVEVEAWQKRLSQEEAKVIEGKRHLLYDIELVNDRSRDYNKTHAGGAKETKEIKLISYSHNKEKLAPLPYGK